MRNRWGILAVLFAVRATMAFQFQSVAAVAPLLSSEYGVGLADVGVLIGLYFAPGVALALPGGAIGQRFGDKATVVGALLLMLAGSVAMASAASWNMQIAGRLVAGAGGVILSVQMTKMLTDWFAGKEIATAMAIFVNSWPAGIAVALLTLPAIGTGYGIAAAHLSVAATAALGMLLISALYKAPPNVVAAPAAAVGLDRHAALAVIAAGLIWGLFNVGFATIFSFGPSMLVERGWSVTAAGSAISIVLWVAAISVPLGGFIADRSGRPRTDAGRGLHPVRRPDDRAAAQRRGDPDRRCARTGQRPAGRTDHEPARPRAAAADPRHRHGPVLHDVLRLHGAGAGGRRRLRQMGRHRRRRIRLRRGDDLAVSAHSLGVQPHSACDTENRVIAPSYNRR